MPNPSHPEEPVRESMDEMGSNVTGPPPNLRRAHRALDRAVDRLYRRSSFASERERVEHLFMLYEKLYTPLGTEMRRNAARRKRR